MAAVKICGLTMRREAGYLTEVFAEKKVPELYAGFVFYDKSRRNVTIQQAKEITELLNQDIKKVAVTVAPGKETALALENAGFDILQVHGRLDGEVLRAVSIPIWLAVNLSKTEELETAKQQLCQDTQRKIQAVLVDAPSYGSGQTFGWEHAKDREYLAVEQFRWQMREKKRKFILAGGLTSENVAEGIRLFSPDIVDVSSGVEGEDGKKDPARIREFIGCAMMKN